jgi:carboxylesterase type B
MVVVTFNYRVNSLGFLPSKLFDEEGLSNLGIRDQRLMLEFVQKHIGSFGGDKDDLTLGGRSAGGHSVGIHYFHNYGEDAGSKPLFSRAIMQSGSVTSRAFPNVAYPLYQRQYAEYMAYIGCDNIDSNSETLACLGNADLNDIRNISNKIFWENHPNVTWPFQPVQGGTLFEKTGTQSGIDDTFFHVPVISSTTSDEGKTYMPGNFETNDEFLGYLHNGSPALNDTDMELLESLYPDPATDSDPNNPFANSPNSTQYNRLSAAWSDYGYACPSQETSYRTSAAGVPTWKLRFNTNNRYPAWQGIPHASDTRYTWNDPAAQYPEISPIYHGYLSSFVTTGDPNTNRYPGSPEWLGYEPEGYGLDQKPGRQLVVQPGDTKMEDDDIRRAACLYWRDPE